MSRGFLVRIRWAQQSSDDEPLAERQTGGNHDAHYIVEFQFRGIRDSGGGGCYDCENQEGGAPLRCCRPEFGGAKTSYSP